MPIGTTFANDQIKLFFQATAIANIADNAASSPLTNLYMSLHTADPSAGNQSTNEITYTGYARVAVARTSGGWTASGNTVSPVATVTFGTRTDNGAVVTASWAGFGTASSGTGKILYSAPIGPGLQRPFSAVTSGNLFTSPAHGFSNGDNVYCVAGAAGSLPTGVTAGTLYFIISASTDTFQLSTTSGGSSITVSASGDGLVAKVTPMSIGLNSVPAITTSAQLVLS